MQGVFLDQVDIHNFLLISTLDNALGIIEHLGEYRESSC